MTPLKADRFAAFTAGVLGFVLLAGLLTASYRLGARSDELGVLPAEFDVLADIYTYVQADAVKVPRDGALAEGAAEGLLAGTGDPYAAYFSEAAYAEFSALLEGSFTGVGLFLEQRPDGLLQVVGVIEGGPAAQAGIEPGERIVSVDGKPVAGLAAEEIVAKVRGPEGTTVRVGFDGGSKGARVVELVRRRLDLPVIESRMLDDGMGYVELLEFSDDAGELVRRAVRDLIGQGAKGIVFDLRGNPGGLLDEAVAVSSVFIDEGVIVREQRREGPPEVYRAKGDAFADIPLVVLVDKGTASAAEIVAAAVRDHRRGRVVGTTTFGKGTVQVVRELPNGGGVKFTVAQYLPPSGGTIEGKGVKPHVEVAGDAAAQLAAAQRELARLAAAPAS